MTYSTVRLWDHDFAFLATEDIPDTEIRTTADRIVIEHRQHQPGALTAAASDLLQQRLRNLYVTIDSPIPGVNIRRGGIIDHLEVTEESCACGHCGNKVITLTIEIAAHPNGRQPENEPIHPPRGYGIGLLCGGNEKDTIIGCWATEEEARQAIAEMRIIKLGDAL